MTNKEIEQKYREAFNSLVPDVFDSVLEKCTSPSKEKTVIVPMFDRRKSIWQKIVSAAAAVVIILTSGIVGSKIANTKTLLSKPETVDSIVSLDVNPSIELLINYEEKIIEANPLNEDAEIVIGDMELKGNDLSLAVNAIIGSMVRNGYMDELSNAILISVDNEDEKKGAKLEKRLSKEVGKLLNAEGLDGAVISQTIKRDNKVTKLAKEYGITSGKAQLIKRITDKYSKYSFTDLVPLSIQQLNLIVLGKEVEVNVNDDTPKKERIGKTKAKEIVLNETALEKDQIYNYKCELNDESVDLVYIVKFDTDTDVYSYTVNAYSGKIENSNIQKGVYVGIEKAKAVALEKVGTTNDQIKFFKHSFAGDNYGMYFRLGLVDYRVSVDAHTGEVVSLKPQGQTNPNVTQTYISEEDVKKILLNELLVTEDKISDYKCVLTKNGNLPVYEVTCKVPYDESDKKEILDCTYVITAATGEVVGVKKDIIEVEEDASQNSSTEIKNTQSQPLESSNVESSNPESSTVESSESQTSNTQSSGLENSSVTSLEQQSSQDGLLSE